MSLLEMIQLHARNVAFLDSVMQLKQLQTLYYHSIHKLIWTVHSEDF